MYPTTNQVLIFITDPKNALCLEHITQYYRTIALFDSLKMRNLRTPANTTVQRNHLKTEGRLHCSKVEKTTGITQNDWTKPQDIFSKSIFWKYPALKTQQPPPPAKMVRKQPTFQFVHEVAEDMHLTSVVMWRSNYGTVIRNQMGMSQSAWCFPTKTILVTILNILIILVMGGYQIDQYRWTMCIGNFKKHPNSDRILSKFLLPETSQSEIVLCSNNFSSFIATCDVSEVVHVVLAVGVLYKSSICNLWRHILYVYL